MASTVKIGSNVHWRQLNNDTSLLGSLAGDERALIYSTATGTTVDAQIERVDLAKNMADYTFRHVGSTMQVWDGAVLLTTINVQADGNTGIAFADGGTTLTLNELGSTMTLAGTTVATASKAAVVPTTAINPSEKSEIGGDTPVPPGPGQTFTLTTGRDVFTGGADDTYFDAATRFEAGTRAVTLNNSDELDGGGGNNTIFIQNLLGGTITPRTLKNMQTVQLDNSFQGGTAFILDVQNGDGNIQTIKSGNNTASAVTVQNVQGKPGKVELTNTDQDFSLITVNAPLVGTQDEVAISLESVTKAAKINVGPTVLGNGYETISVVSTGTLANSVILGQGKGNTWNTLNVTGAQDLTLNLTGSGGTAANTLTRIDASAFTGKLNFKIDNTSTAKVSLTGGTNNDTIDMDTTYTSDDSIDGGLGIDTLRVSLSAATAATTKQTNVKNIEIIATALTTGTVNVANFGATGFVFDTAILGASAEIVYATGTNSLNLANLTVASQTLKATVLGTSVSDVLNISTTGHVTAAGWNTSTAGAETVNIDTTGAAVIFTGTFAMTDTVATERLNIRGDGNVTFTGAVTADFIDFTGLTGTAAATMSATTTNACRIEGSARADLLNGSASNDMIFGGSGNDTIIGAAGGDIIDGGGGKNTYRFTSVTDSNVTSLTSYDKLTVTSGDVFDSNVAMTVGTYVRGIQATTAITTAANLLNALTEVLDAGTTNLTAGAGYLVNITDTTGVYGGTYFVVEVATSASVTAADTVMYLGVITGTATLAATGSDLSIIIS